MQAVILAGGPKWRLHPIDVSTPKFMFPLFDCPILEHLIRLLVRHGFEDIIITMARECTDAADYLGDGRRFGARIRYCVEGKPLGTAGALKALEHVLEDTFVALPGDIVTDVDLTSAVAFHNAQKSVATVIATKSPDSALHTCLHIGDGNKVTRVSIKPSTDEPPTPYVFTGIAILNKHVVKRIPPFESRDIDRDLIPRLLMEAEFVRAYVAEHYWADVGTVLACKAVHFDALEGRLKLDIGAEVVEPGIWIGQRAQIDPTAEIWPPVYIGSGVRIGPNAVIGARAVIGDESVVERESTIKGSVVGRGCRIAPRSSIIGCLLGTQYRTEESESMLNCSAFVQDSAVLKGIEELEKAYTR
jgi:mannose-1-phosphate guanylyltransferase/phosphomannomutase